MTKFILIQLFSRRCCPLMMSMSPGTMKPKLSDVIPVASQMSRMCRNTPMIKMMKQLPIFMITFENIWFMRMLLIIRLNPSIIPMQKMLGKFYFDSTPNTPQNSSNDSSLPPKKYPNQMKLNPMKKLKMKTFKNLGYEGVWYLSEKYTLITDPRMERQSPQILEKLEQERQISLGCP